MAAPVLRLYDGFADTFAGAAAGRACFTAERLRPGTRLRPERNGSARPLINRT